MRIAVFMMAACVEPSTRNSQAFKNTVVKYCNDNKDRLKNTYEFYVYSALPVEDHENCDIVSAYTQDEKYDNLHYIVVNESESVYRTFEKTYDAFWYVDHDLEEKYDLYVRVNISMYLNIDLLDNVADKLKPGNVYCNAINSYVNLNSEYCNDLYPRGDLMIFDHKILEDIIYGDLCEYLLHDDLFIEANDVDHVDDCLIGVCLINSLGKDYYKHLYMLKYNYLPDTEIDMKKISSYAIGSRIKTVPPEVGYSGYSWDDNDYRKKDVEKFHYLYDYYNNKEFDYSNVKMADVLVDKSSSRPTLFVHAQNVNVFDVFWKFLEQKRK